MSFYKLHRRGDKSEFTYQFTTRKHFKEAIENPDMWIRCEERSPWWRNTLHVSLGIYMQEFSKGDRRNNRESFNFDEANQCLEGNYMHLHFDPELQGQDIRLGDSDEVLNLSKDNEKIRQWRRDREAQLKRENQS